MTEFIERPDGIVVPRPPPEPPGREYGSMEIRDESERKKAREALRILWHAMGLYNPGPIVLPPYMPKYEDSYRLYRYLGESILGDECPDFEQLT